MERYRFTLLSSGRDLLRETGPRKLDAPLLVGAPDFDAALPSASGAPGALFGRVHFAPLAGTDRETRKIAGLLPDARRLAAAEATKDAVLAIHAPRLLHVATHGFFLAPDASAKAGQRALTLVDVGGTVALPKDPLVRSGLAFAGANRSGGAAVLSALEASNLDLWGTKLVVLSACETAVGDVEPGEGVLGLRRALVLAGSETQVMSLWKVSDDATESLMVQYYTRALAGSGRSEAMRDAQLTLAAAPSTSHPYYWSAFVVSGEDAPLSGGAPGSVREVSLSKVAPAAPPRVAPGARGCGCEAIPAGDAPPVAALLAIAVAAVRRARRRPA